MLTSYRSPFISKRRKKVSNEIRWNKLFLLFNESVTRYYVRRLKVYLHAAGKFSDQKCTQVLGEYKH